MGIGQYIVVGFGSKFSMKVFQVALQPFFDGSNTHFTQKRRSTGTEAISHSTQSLMIHHLCLNVVVASINILCCN
jgi:hypothetical protein